MQSIRYHQLKGLPNPQDCQRGVEWIIEGSLLQLGGKLQVVVQLIDTQADAHAWAEMGQSVAPWSMARALAATGDAEKAITFLNEAFEAHSSSMPFLGQTPMLHSIRSRSEVQELMKKIGLPL